jgi:hypothetical protein
VDEPIDLRVDVRIVKECRLVAWLRNFQLLQTVMESILETLDEVRAVPRKIY